ncbi:SITS-binding protein-like [Symsagittifera roscoffensis]|uniref:SITS-binding protein-like n=1 Tax=Symsagittifera roscoffensis TaxID=84072 RepID=UPI00307C0DC2
MITDSNMTPHFSLLTSVPEHNTTHACLLMSPLPFTWSALNSLVPQIVSMALNGQKCVIPPPPVIESSGFDQELFKRWIQLTVHFPSFVFDSPCLSLLPQALTSPLRSILSYRSQILAPQIQFANSQTSPMEPILRPLWFDYPEDPKAFLCNDQFLLGSEYIVAPILEAGVDYRNVYLPQEANWKYCPSGICSSLVYEGGSQVDVRTSSDHEVILFHICKFCTPTATSGTN